MAPDDTPRPLDPLAASWNSEHSPPPIDLEELRATADARRYRTRLVMAGEGILTAGLVGLSATFLVQGGPASAANRAWLLVAWLTWVAVTGFATWNRRGVARAKAESTRSYVALLEERARRRVRGAAFVLGAVAVMALAAGVLGYLGTASGTLLGLYGGWAIWYGVRARQDVDEMRRVRSDLGGET